MIILILSLNGDFSNDLSRRAKEQSNKKSYGGIKGSNEVYKLCN